MENKHRILAWISPFDTAYWQLGKFIVKYIMNISVDIIKLVQGVSDDTNPNIELGRASSYTAKEVQASFSLPTETFTRTQQDDIDKQYYTYCCLALGYITENFYQIDFENDFALARHIVRASGHKGKQPDDPLVKSRMDSIRAQDASASFGLTQTRVTSLTPSHISESTHLDYVNTLLNYHKENYLKSGYQLIADKLNLRDVYCPYDNNPLYGFVHLETGIIFGSQNSPGLENIKVQMNLANEYLQLAIKSSDEEVIISNIACFIRAMSFAHPYPFVNYSITMLFVNAVLINKFGIIVPHGNLDTQLCYVSRKEAGRIFNEYLVNNFQAINTDNFKNDYRNILAKSLEG